METVARFVEPAESVVQDPPLGTGDAVRTGSPPSPAASRQQGSIEDVLVLFGDTPLLRSETLARLLGERSEPSRGPLGRRCGRPIPAPTAGSFSAPDGSVERIVEAADAGPEERGIGLVLGRLMADRRRATCPSSSKRSIATTPRANST